MDNYEHIYNATDKRLADMLDEIANGAEKGLNQIEISEEILEIMKQENAAIREAARRLRAYQKREIFNDEQFNV